MDESIRLGRVAGIRVGLNWSVLVTFWLVTWLLASTALPDAAPGHPRATYWAFAVAGAVMFLTSLFLHELAHAIVARRNGVTVRGITLWLFGGVARLDTDAVTPGAELRIALAGPGTSVALGFAWFGIAAVVSALDVGIAAVLFGWLAFINIVLALFNLLPAAPLDGGRVLHALLWRRHGDALRATVTAARAGRIFAFVLVGLGLLEFFAGGVLGGIWLVFLGWFLLSAARAEEESTRLERSLAGVRVGDVMTADPIVAPQDTSIASLIDMYVFTHRCSAFPLQDASGQVSGLVTLGQIKAVPEEQRSTTAAAAVATPIGDVPRAAPDEPLLEVMKRLDPRGPGRVLVFDGDRLVGIVSPTDVQRTLQIAALRS
jgi:Zn-dependent protease/predicted transcriptional regulator